MNDTISFEGLTERELLRFPPGFFWGTATSAYQIEGATTADGRGPSTWDRFCAIPGKVSGGGTGDPACDHYNRYVDDVALMARLGMGAYRFSIAWPRIQPNGRRWEPRGLDFYDRLVDELLQRGITPMPTLYHWDLPQALQEAGGWASRATAFRFVDYALEVHSRLGDRIEQWTTLNEPWCSAFLGYYSGMHAPGVTDPVAALLSAHHLLLGHGMAVRAMREQARPEHRFSIVLNFARIRAVGDNPSHAEAVRKVDGMQNRYFLWPLLGAGYPEDILTDLEWLGPWQKCIVDGDLRVIAEPLDWLGVNYYTCIRVESSEEPGTPCWLLPGLRGVRLVPGSQPLTGTGWEQDPAGFTNVLRWIHAEATQLPLVITENGAAFSDILTPDRQVIDTSRAQYFVEHLRAVHAAITEGADVRGYLACSLLDNFEWTAGYTQRFGLVHVDFATQRRTVKYSGALYAAIAAANAIPTIDVNTFMG